MWVKLYCKQGPLDCMWVILHFKWGLVYMMWAISQLNPVKCIQILAHYTLVHLRGSAVVGEAFCMTHIPP